MHRKEGKKEKEKRHRKEVKEVEENLQKLWIGSKCLNLEKKMKNKK